MPSGVYKRTKYHGEIMRKTAKKYGFGKWMEGKKHSEKTKEKMRKHHKTKRGFSSAMKGKCHKEETKEKIGFANRTEKHWNWQGGKIIDKNRYVLIKKSDHPYCNSQGYIREHRLVVEKIIGRYLLPNEKCHHLGAKDDNRSQMLMAFINDGVHKRFEKTGKVKFSEIIFDGRKLDLECYQKKR